MGAAFVFFMSERSNVAPQYRTTMTISALIVGIAAFHYYYMRGVYADCGEVSVEYRYMDWIITVPLMALKFPTLVGKGRDHRCKKVAGLGFTGICFTRCAYHDWIWIRWRSRPDERYPSTPAWWHGMGNDCRCNRNSLVRLGLASTTARLRQNSCGAQTLFAGSLSSAGSSTLLATSSALKSN